MIIEKNQKKGFYNLIPPCGDGFELSELVWKFLMLTAFWVLMLTLKQIKY